MEIMIIEDGKIEQLNLISPDTGVNYISDFIGNAGGFDGGKIEYDEDNEIHYCTRAEFNWWKKVVADEQKLNDRIYDIQQAFGVDYLFYLFSKINVDIEDHAKTVNAILDQHFG